MNPNDTQTEQQTVAGTVVDRITIQRRGATQEILIEEGIPLDPARTCKPWSRGAVLLRMKVGQSILVAESERRGYSGYAQKLGIELRSQITTADHSLCRIWRTK